MIALRGDRTGRAVTWGLVFGLALGCGGRALAQGHTPDPYNIVGEYNRQYEPYMYATTPNEQSAMPNQYRLDSRAGNRNANQFQSMLDDPDGELGAEARAAFSRNSAPSLPYYKANRLDSRYQRGSGPNQYADRDYLAGQKERTDKYFQALRETDPKKRAELFREYREESVRSALNLSGGRNASAPARARDEPDRTDPVDPLAPRAGVTPGAGRRPSTTAPTRSPGASGLSTRRGPGLAPPPTSRLIRPQVGPNDASPRLRSRVGGNTFRSLDREGESPSAVMDRSDRLDREATPSRSRTTAPPPLSRPVR